MNPLSWPCFRSYKHFQILTFFYLNKLKHGIRHSNIELKCARRGTYGIEEKGENNMSDIESFKLAVLRSFKNF